MPSVLRLYRLRVAPLDPGPEKLRELALPRGSVGAGCPEPENWTPARGRGGVGAFALCVTEFVERPRRVVRGGAFE
jgi:hypothetical protein